MVMLFIALALPQTVLLAQTSGSNTNALASEQRVKAASIYKFLNYVEWPPASFAKPNSPYVIGVIAEDDVANELMRISAGRTVNNRSLTIRKLQAGDGLHDLHVLFIGKAERSAPSQLLKQASPVSILVITETQGALAQGSMINFRIVDERVRFEVALDPVEKSGLKISSRMLAIALNVIKGP